MFFVIVAIGLSGFVGSAHVCDNGWRAYKNHCYWFSDDKAVFSNAVTNCFKFGSTLVEFCGKEEERWAMLQNRIKGYDLVWIGYTDSLEEGKYVYASSGETPSYFNWLKGQPHKGKTENCAAVEMTEMKWHDYPCSHPMFYICKKPAKHYA
mmetsp:Transcript_23928/g.38169  ORF Transcript_23928/g.38169 Transcript_23928/m.38169 type:complete len:151 (+) Transcript_23928:67-519(+)